MVDARAHDWQDGAVTGVEHKIGLRAATRSFAAALAAHAGRRGVVTVALVAAGAVLEGVTIALLVPILTIVLAHGGDGRALALLRAAGVTGSTGQLATLLGGFVALMTMRAAVLYHRDVALARLQTRFIEDLRNRVVARLAAASWQRLVTLRHARVTNLLGADIGRVAASAHLLIQMGVAAAMLTIQAAIALILAPALAAVVVAAVVVGLAATLIRARRSRDRGAALSAAHLTLMQTTAGFLGGLKAAMAEHAQDRFVAEFAAVQAEMHDHFDDFTRRQARSRAAIAFGSALAAVAVVAVGVASGLASGVLVTLIVLFARMSAPVTAIQGALQTFVFGLPSFEAVRALERDLGDDASPVDARSPPPGAIACVGASFAHADGGGVTAIDLRIDPGAIVGLTGPSGAGKTTLIDMLAGLIAPQSGAVAIGGVPLDDGLRAGWRRTVGYVAQDGFLFHDSVRRNLARSGVDDPAAIAAALAVTGGDAVVAGLADGLDTVVGERGARLSGGERQRLAIARALLRRPRLLILDEATSAIDVAGEAALLDRLLALDPRPAIVIVAHRAESLARCDRVVRLDRGTIVA